MDEGARERVKSTMSEDLVSRRDMLNLALAQSRHRWAVRVSWKIRKLYEL